MIYRGIVENNVKDVSNSKQLGLVQVRVFGVHSQDTTLIPTKALPWANVQGSNGFGLIGGVGLSSVLQIGTWVYIMFEGDDLDLPIVTGTVVGVNTETKEFADLPSSNRLNMSDLHPNVQANPQDVQVIETKSGHIIELSDVSGAEEISITHSTGTVIKFEVDGSLSITSGANINLNATGNLTVNATKVDLGVGGTQIARIGDTVQVNPTSGTGTITACASLNTSI